MYTVHKYLVECFGDSPAKSEPEIFTGYQTQTPARYEKKISALDTGRLFSRSIGPSCDS
jgi:hypothetical protein